MLSFAPDSPKKQIPWGLLFLSQSQRASFFSHMWNDGEVLAIDGLLRCGTFYSTFVWPIRNLTGSLFNCNCSCKLWWWWLGKVGKNCKAVQKLLETVGFALIPGIMEALLLAGTIECTSTRMQLAPLELHKAWLIIPHFEIKRLLLISCDDVRAHGAGQR